MLCHCILYDLFVHAGFDHFVQVTPVLVVVHTLGVPVLNYNTKAIMGYHL